MFYTRDNAVVFDLVLIYLQNDLSATDNVVVEKYQIQLVATQSWWLSYFTNSIYI